MGLFTAMDVKSHVITNDENGIQSIISNDKAKVVPTKTHEATRIALNLVRSARSTALRNTYTGHSGPSEYLVDKVAGHHHTSEDPENNIHYHGCTPDEATLEPASHIPHKYTSRYWNNYFK